MMGLDWNFCAKRLQAMLIKALIMGNIALNILSEGKWLLY